MAYVIAPDDLLEAHGTTHAAQAGITLRDKPAPLFQLVVLAMLSSAPISGDVAAESARELFRAGWRTPERMRGASWQQRVDALGRGGYRRYDESTSERLDELAERVIDEVKGDLRRWRPARHDQVDELRKALQRVPGIGPTGSAIFCVRSRPCGRWDVPSSTTERSLQLGLSAIPPTLGAWASSSLRSTWLTSPQRWCVTRIAPDPWVR